MTTFTHTLRSTALLALLVPMAAGAQARAPRAPEPPDAPEPPRRPSGQTMYVSGNSDRGYLGITPRYRSGAADTLGVLVDDVEDGLGADKAGVRRGDRIAQIDGVDLRLDPRDIGDSSGEALPESRLRRVMERSESGDTVSVVIIADGRKETRRVILSEAPMPRALGALGGLRTINNRRVIGVSFSQRGSMRDTAGLLITSISADGAADKAGIAEGDRIVRINDVDLRVPAEDAGTPEGVEARISRLRRTLDAARDGESVRLEVITDGRRRTVSVVPKVERGFAIMSGDGAAFAEAYPGNISITIPRAEMARARSDMARASAETARARAELQREMVRAGAESQREMARELREMERESARDLRDASRDGRTAPRGTVRGRTDGATLVLSGLSLAAVDRDFAQQFGRGSEDGALVVRTRREWEPIRTGDVILSIEGRSVRDGNSLDISFDRDRDQRLEIIRSGRRETITLPASR